MKNILIVSLFGILVGCTSQTQEKPEKTSLDSESPSVGEVIVDSLDNLKEDSTEITLPEKSKEPVEVLIEKPIEPSVPVQEPSPDFDKNLILKTVQSCDKLVRTITKNSPGAKPPVILENGYEKLDSNDSKVTVEFEALDMSKTKLTYTGYCIFDSKGNLKSFSANPVKKLILEEK